MKKKREIGFEFEDLAKKYLIEKGMRYIESNFYTRYGEIDLVFTDEDEKILVFVEVRYRKNAEFGEPIETIDRRKLEKSLWLLAFCKWRSLICFQNLLMDCRNSIFYKMH